MALDWVPFCPHGRRLKQFGRVWVAARLGRARSTSVANAVEQFWGLMMAANAAASLEKFRAGPLKQFDARAEGRHLSLVFRIHVSASLQQGAYHCERPIRRRNAV